jgi:hypothetical protein
LTFYTIDRAHRRIAERNLEAAFPARPAAERRAIARAAFVHFGRLLFELLKFSTLSPASMLARVEFDGEERARLAYAQGKGVLFVTGHFGFWELHAIVHAIQIAPIGLLARALDNPQLNQLLEDIRPAHRQHGDLSPRHHPARHARAAGGAGRRGADRSAHHGPRCHLRRLLRPAGGNHVRGGGAGAADRGAGGAGVRVTDWRRTDPSDLRASDRAA